MAIPPSHIQEIPPSGYLVSRWNNLSEQIPPPLMLSENIAALWNNLGNGIALPLSDYKEIQPSPFLFQCWNNLRAANTRGPSLHVHLFKIGTSLEYRVIRRDKVLKNGKFPYNDADRREPIIDDNLNVEFALRIFRWKNRGRYVNVLRTDAVFLSRLFFQIHDPINDTRRHLPLACHSVSLNCSKGLQGLIHAFESNLSLAPKLQYFIGFERSFEQNVVNTRHSLDKKVIQARYYIVIFPGNEILIDLELLENVSLNIPSRSLQDIGAPFFSRKANKIVIDCFRKYGHNWPRSYCSVSAVSLSSKNIQLIFAPNSKGHAPSPKQSSQGIADLSINENYLGLELQVNPELDLPADDFVEVILEPRRYSYSMFNPKIKVTHVEWAVTLLRDNRGKYGNHALAAIEGIADEDFVLEYSSYPSGKNLKVDEYFKAFVEFTGAEVRLKFTKEIDFTERGSIQLVEAERAKALIENVHKAPCPVGSVLGRFVFPNSHNCYTFLQEVGMLSGIDFGVRNVSSFGSILSMPSEKLTQPPGYYRVYPDVDKF
ncbi:MAG: hypothetical protein LLG04_17770 [Parachlamydia sp.]|nr:hypothetical protein [Parachlamydia sp.]